MENKYFVPNIEDLHIGYECEVTTLGTDEPIWHISDDVRKGRLETYDIQNIDFGDLYVRTPYLTAEQIEDEGWILKTNKTWDYKFEMHCHYNTYFMSFSPYQSEAERELLLIGHFLEENFEYMYKGTCPSINEFRKIMSLLEFK